MSGRNQPHASIWDRIRGTERLGKDRQGLAGKKGKDSRGTQQDFGGNTLCAGYMVHTTIYPDRLLAYE